MNEYTDEVLNELVGLKIPEIIMRVYDTAKVSPNKCIIHPDLKLGIFRYVDRMGCVSITTDENLKKPLTLCGLEVKLSILCSPNKVFLVCPVTQDILSQIDCNL